MSKPFDTKVDLGNDVFRSIFNAALTGIIANPDFFGPLSQGQPETAVNFAKECVLVVIHEDKYVRVHERALAKEGE